MVDIIKKPEKELSIFKLFDELDDKLIKEELKGIVSEKWVYSFKTSEGKEFTGLSKRGIDQATILLTKTGNIIREESVNFVQDPTDKDYFLFTAVVAQYAIREDGTEYLLKKKIGTKRQWTKMMLKNGTIVPDEFWFEKGSMKAIRNATARLIDDEIIAQIKQLALQEREKRVHEVNIEQAQAKPQKTMTKELARFWAQFKQMFDYQNNIEAINDVLHRVLEREFGKKSLKDERIDYDRLLEILLVEPEMIQYLKNT